MGDACLGSALKRRRCCGRKPLLPIRGANRIPLTFLQKSRADSARRVPWLRIERNYWGVEGRGALTKYAVSRHGAHQSVSSTQRHMEERYHASIVTHESRTLSEQGQEEQGYLSPALWPPLASDSQAALHSCTSADKTSRSWRIGRILPDSSEAWPSAMTKTCHKTHCARNEQAVRSCLDFFSRVQV